jgi:hypothetical protein
MKTLKALLGLAVLVGAFYLAWMLVPPYFNNYELEDYMAQEARFNTYTAKSETDMRESIYKKAQDLTIPLTREQINVQRISNGVSISADYTVHVDLPLYPIDMTFHPASKNKGY